MVLLSVDIKREAKEQRKCEQNIHLILIWPYLQNVVDQSKQGSEGKGCDKNCDESKLDDDLQILVEEQRVVSRSQTKVLDIARLRVWVLGAPELIQLK